MKKFKNSSSKTLFLCFGVVVLLTALTSWLQFRDFETIVNVFFVGIFGYGGILFFDYFFTYLKIDENKRQITALSFLFSQNRVKVDSITRITKEPHPVFKQTSWAIFIHYKIEKGKEKHFEIWPSFSPETIGKFLSEIQKLNPKIDFDAGCKDWMEKYGIKN